MPPTRSRTAWMRSCWRERPRSARFAARAVQTLDAIIRDAEATPPEEWSMRRHDHASTDHAQALCEAAVTLANRGDAQAIVAVTRGGGTRGGCRRSARARRSSRRPIATTRRAGSRSLGRRAGLHRYRRERGFGRGARQRATRGARARGARRGHRAGEHQRRPHARRRQLSEDARFSDPAGGSFSESPVSGPLACRSRC